MRAVGYIRVSTEEQAREGFGLADQESKIRALATLKGWELLEVYSDAGRSGKTTTGRQAMLKLLQDAKARQFERVVFKRFDRLGRNLREMLASCDTLESSGVGLVSIDEAIDTSTPHGRMMRNMIGTFAEFEREIIVDRIKAGISEKAREGHIVGPVSLGYRREAGSVIEDESTAPLIREMFSLYADGGHSLRQLAEWAASVGLTSTEGNPLDRLSIRKILVNDVYMGVVSFHKRRGGTRVSDGRHPALIRRELFDDVQQQLVIRRREQTSEAWGRHSYPTSGVAFCAYCGSALVGCQSGKGYRYLRCSVAARLGRHACQQPMVQAGLIESQIGAYLSGMTLPSEYVAAVLAELRRRHESNPDVAQATAERDSLESQVDRLRRLFVLGEIDEVRFKRDRTSLQRRIESLAPPPLALDLHAAASYLQSISNLWQGSERQTQRAFVGEVFERITVKGAQVVEIAPKSTYAPLFTIDRHQRFGGVMGMCSWLPGLISQSAIRDVVNVRLASLANWARRQPIGDRVEEWSRQLADHAVENRAELARRNGLSRARITQVLGPSSA